MTRPILAALAALLLGCDAEPAPTPTDAELRKSECPPEWLEAELDFLADMEDAEALAICRADCTRAHVSCLAESPADVCSGCQFEHAACMDSCEAEEGLAAP